jgi:uncharacterized protein
LLLLSFLAMWLLAYINDKIYIGEQLTELQKKQDAAVAALAIATTPHHAVASIIIVALFAAIGEELFFRAVLQRIFINITKSPWLGILLASLVFAGLHLQFKGFLPRFGLGIVLGALCWYSGSVWTSILYHFLFNGLQVLTSYNKPDALTKNDTLEQVGNNLPISIALGIMAIAGIVYIIIQMKKQSKTSYQAEFSKVEPSIFQKSY